jgi:hypothetical protein
MFLQITTQFASLGSVILPSQPIRLVAEDKLAALRRLDKAELGTPSMTSSIAPSPIIRPLAGETEFDASFQCSVQRRVCFASPALTPLFSI